MPPVEPNGTASDRPAESMRRGQHAHRNPAPRHRFPTHSHPTRPLRRRSVTLTPPTPGPILAARPHQAGSLTRGRNGFDGDVDVRAARRGARGHVKTGNPATANDNNAVALAA